MASKIVVPTTGSKITVNKDNSLNVPNNPIIPFIEGDGIGADITLPMMKVVDAAVHKAYGGTRKIAWMEVYAGEKATKVYGENDWLPQETMKAVRDYVVSIKGPLTTPVGGGIRSLNAVSYTHLDVYKRQTLVNPTCEYGCNGRWWWPNAPADVYKRQVAPVSSKNFSGAPFT